MTERYDFRRPFQESFIFVEVTPPLDGLHEGQLTEERGGADTEDVLEDSQLVVGQLLVLLPQQNRAVHSSSEIYVAFRHVSMA